MTKPVLSYFDITFWRGEVPRLCFVLGGIDFEDKRVSFGEFKKMKEAGELPFGQLPILEYEGTIITQAFAIVRFVGKKAGLVPSDALQEARADEVIHILEELQAHITPALKEKDPAKKKSMRQELSNVVIPQTMQKFEHLLANDKTFFAGDALSIADLCVWKFVHWIKSGIIDDVDAASVSGFPALDRNFEAVDTNPKILEWKKTHANKYSI